jgi:hypothetical protein
MKEYEQMTGMGKLTLSNVLKKELDIEKKNVSSTASNVE